MSGTQKTAEQVGALVGATPEAAKHTAKVLRSAATTDRARSRVDLWPRPGRGMRSVTFTPTHLTNLLLALGCGHPIRAAETVKLFRNLRSWTETRTGPTSLMIDGGGQATGSGLVLPGFTFGEDLDVLVETFASPDIDSVRSSLPTIEVIATVQPHPGAEIIQVSQDRKSSLSTAYREGTGQFEIPLNEENEQAISTLQRVFYGAAFEALASIWNGTKAAPRQRVLPASGQDASKHETTTSSGRGAAA